MDASFHRAIKAGLKNFVRNGWLSIATTSVIGLTLFITSILLGLLFVSSYVLGEIQDKISVSVYFKTNASQEKIDEVKKDLEIMPEVKKVEYTSRDDALMMLREKYQNNEVIVESLREIRENPLEASLSILVYDPSKYESIENKLIAGKYKDLISKMDYSDHRGEIERLNKIIKSIKKVGFLIILTLVAVSVLVTFNSIRLTMYTYRAEVEIMRLVGASNWFVRLPFITEGILYGLFAALLVSVCWYPLASYLAPFFVSSGLQLDLVELLNQNFIYVLGIEISGGVLMGAVSSFIAIRRYLRA